MAETSHAIALSLLAEFEQEMASTRRCLERVPEALFGWKPHAKSYSMGELVSHLASVPGWLVVTLDQDAFDTAPGGIPAVFPRAKSVREAIEMHDAGVVAGKAALLRTDDARFAGTWSLLGNGATFFTMPRTAVVRSFVMNHLVHHRGQLTVYLRLNDLPVPAIYGPSADESGA